MKKIKFSVHPCGGLNIDGFTPMVAMALSLKIQGIGYKGLHPHSDGSIRRFNELYTVFTTAMMIKLALNAIGEDIKEYEFVNDVPASELEKGDFYTYLNSFDFTKGQYKHFGELDDTVKALTEPMQKTRIPYSIVKDGDSLSMEATISSIYQFTTKTPIYATQVDSGGRSMDEGFMVAVIAYGVDGLYYPYLVVNNEGQEVDHKDLAGNRSNSSFFLFEPCEDPISARDAILKKYDETAKIVKDFATLSADGDYWEPLYNLDEFEKLTNFQKGFSDAFDGYFDENFSSARRKIEKILADVVFLSIDNERNILSERELLIFKNTKEFKTFNFVEEK